MFIAVFLTFLPIMIVCFCSHIVVHITEFDASFIQVRVLASFNTRFNAPFATLENACTKPGICQLLSIRLSFEFFH